MRTVVIAGGTRGIGGALADRMRAAGDRVVALGSADADLSSMRQTVELIKRLPTRIDVLVLSAGWFGQRRIVTEEGLERSFAIYVVGRYLLAERLRPALRRAPAPVILNLCGTGGITAGRIHWDDLQLARGYSLFRATMQGARANDLLGVAFAARESGVRYVLYNPLLVDSGMHRMLAQPWRAITGAAAAAFGATVERTAADLANVLDDPPPPGLTALRRARAVPLTRPEFDADDAARLESVLADLTAGV
jgi:NAD(P)-dependent dehydrogenase (short-subunit alcohol dehydrogenase family)